ncbi:peptidyl-Lys metalloendopeptidase [Cantharellus anzutake]|uniref:peptidyl-Lys metalloendopeptidase n=1 Tax=Cantharellus anzutake TaxID=1750568 RepID=UPI001908660C|nr:peptidyl-Lys metalloendopeptidase [Cantharellus anzutake]KAF8314559.1 peptidyl-Lys metalloendopeptidase [Cantharellus anzutake]
MDILINQTTSRARLSPRYHIWYGNYTRSRGLRVRRIFQVIHAAQDGQLSTNTYDCSCTTSGSYGYVNNNEFGTVYLCPGFWTALPVGSNSRPGLLINLISPFRQNGGTMQLATGTAACQALAKTSPRNATRNADSYEYFAENFPPLP